MRYVIIGLLSFVCAIGHAQDNWEKVTNKSFVWNTPADVYVSSNSLADLTVWNYHYEPVKNVVNNKWSHKRVTMNLNWEESLPWEITFYIRNDRSNPDSR